MSNQLSQIQDALSFALQADLESGVQWINEQNSEEFARKYPQLCHVLNNIQEMDDE